MLSPKAQLCKLYVNFEVKADLWIFFVYSSSIFDLVSGPVYDIISTVHHIWVIK